MNLTGMLYGARLLEFVGFPATEVLGPDASISSGCSSPASRR